MAEPSIIDGNIFTTNCQTLVNTINCVGVMGAGIALECRLRYPDMHNEYISLCERRRIDIGSLWLYKSPDRWILNFPTKRHWKDPSREEYLHAGLRKFMDTYEEEQIESIAFPLLGAQHGGIDSETSQDIMESYLCNCVIPVEIYRYDPEAPDDLFDKFCDLVKTHEIDEVSQSTGLRRDFVIKIREALENPQICQLNRLASVDGIGIRTLERVFRYVCSKDPAKQQQYQQTLDLR